MPNQVKFNAQDPTIEKSKGLYERARKRIPSQTQTLAKGPGQHVKGVAPMYLERGKGARVWDVDGNEYLDFSMAIGPLSLGYTYPRVDAAIRDQLDRGITFSLMHPLEVELAELIQEVVPMAEAVRYSKTGADATSAAIRAARAFTKRKKVLCCGYHGWHDWYISVTARNDGIPKEIQDLSYTISYNDLASAEKAIDSDTACVILEPTVFEAPKPGFLQGLKDLCQKNGTLLVFDEMWTGFRLAMGGAQEAYGVQADLVTYSKAIANGMPISVLAGRKDVMDVFDQNVFFYTTFGGEALSLAAAKATILELREKNVPKVLAEKGKKMREGYNAIAARLDMPFTKCGGYDQRTMVSFDASTGQDPLVLKSFVQQELIRRGILWSGFHNLSFSHTNADLDYALSAYEDVLPLLKKAVEQKNVLSQLRGEPVQAVFRRITDFNMKPKV